MTRLIVVDSNNIEHELDMYGNENVNITLQVDDIRNIESKNASYSKSFNIPATKKNNRFFTSFYNIDSYGSNNAFSVYSIIKSFLFVDDVLVLEGFMRLENALEKNTETSYSIVLFNDVANIIETLADSTLAHLSYTDINHDFTTANIQNSWADNSVVTSSGGTTDNVYYALTNDGQLYFQNEGANLIADYKTHYMLNVKLRYIIDKIFAFAGFEYVSNFFDSTTFGDIFFDVGRALRASDLASLTIEADTGTGTHSVSGELGTLISNDIFNPTVISFANESNDLNNNFNQSTSVFTAPYDCTLNITYQVTAINFSLTTFGSIFLFAQGTQIGEFSIPSADTNDDTPITAQHVFTGSVDLLEGDNVTMQFVVFGSDEVTIFNTTPILTLEVIDTSTSQQIKANRGSIKLADIIKDVVKCFNLTIESNGSNTLRIEPYKDFIGTSIIDWTKKMSSAEYIVEPVEIPRRIEFNHAEDDKDFYHGQYLSNNFQRYGSQIIEFPVDSTDVMSIDLKVFAAPFIKELENTNVNLQHIAELSSELRPFNHKPRLIFKNRTSINDSFNTIEYADNGSVEYTLSTYNNGTPYEDEANNTTCPITTLTADSDSLMFGFTNTTYIPTISAIPLNTLYNKYWSQYINEKFNTSTGRIYKAEFYLKPTDIMNFTFDKIVKVNEQHYRVNKIEYNTDINTLAKVELIRI